MTNLITGNVETLHHMFTTIATLIAFLQTVAMVPWPPLDPPLTLIFLLLSDIFESNMGPDLSHIWQSKSPLMRVLSFVIRSQ